ncbi:hypothetical protein PVAP13_7KG047099 [Panicum virgatum]|uniref:Uncharacterized protein n=1 Tax=Panicum virgatum TaxID=38727 RepID=A0A8T0QBG0_PANVG|nr:hypothetical protein PVAP13_7KG047099 [Panicum virgatum]
MASSSCPYEEDSSSGGEPSINKPQIQAPVRQESEEEESESAPPEPRIQPKGKSSSMCQCIRGQMYCRQCIRLHHCLPADTNVLSRIFAQMNFKCDCKKYIPYFEFLEHRRDCPSAKYSTPPARWKCMLKTSLLQCSECEAPIRPPIFLLWSNNLICSACYRGDISTYGYRHCTELEYLLRAIKVKCIACKQYFPFSWLGLRQVGDCPFKCELQNIAPGSSAPKKLCDEEETERPMAGNNSIHGKSKRKVHFEVASDDDSYDASYDDNHMNMKAPGLQRATVLSLVESDDGSSDDIHPESGMRVAENAFNTHASNKKVKIATPYGQKTGSLEATSTTFTSSPSRP